MQIYVYIIFSDVCVLCCKSSNFGLKHCLKCWPHRKSPFPFFTFSYFTCSIYIQLLLAPICAVCYYEHDCVHGYHTIYLITRNWHKDKHTPGSYCPKIGLDREMMCEGNNHGPLHISIWHSGWYCNGTPVRCCNNSCFWSNIKDFDRKTVTWQCTIIWSFAGSGNATLLTQKLLMNSILHIYTEYKQSPHKHIPVHFCKVNVVNVLQCPQLMIHIYCITWLAEGETTKPTSLMCTHMHVYTHDNFADLVCLYGHWTCTCTCNIWHFQITISYT